MVKNKAYYFKLGMIVCVIHVLVTFAAVYVHESTDLSFLAMWLFWLSGFSFAISWPFIYFKMERAPR